jgi:hypothetical protein
MYIPQWGSCNLLKLPAKGNEAKLELAAKLFQRTKIKIKSSSNELREARKNLVCAPIKKDNCASLWNYSHVSLSASEFWIRFQPFQFNQLQRSCMIGKYSSSHGGGGSHKTC